MVHQHLVTRRATGRKSNHSQIQAAEDVRKKAMDLLQKGIEARDSKKVSAANAILERSD